MPAALAIDPHLVDVLLPDLVGHDKRPSSFVLYLWLYAMTRGVGRKSAFFSYQMLTDRTGLSKRAVQRVKRIRRIHEHETADNRVHGGAQLDLPEVRG